MFDFLNHKEWINKVIDSCSTMEQLDCAKVLISLFVVQMSKAGMTLITSRTMEDELLAKWIERYSQIMIL